MGILRFDNNNVSVGGTILFDDRVGQVGGLDEAFATATGGVSVQAFISEEQRQLNELSGMLLNQEARVEKAEKLLKSIQKERDATVESIRKIKEIVHKKEIQRDEVNKAILRKGRGFHYRDDVSQPGVYLLAIEDRIVYVGQSKNPHARIPQHKDKEFTHVRILRCPERRLTYWESVLIRKINPVYNKTLKKYRRRG
jgi:predicted GIY-YIG superfamily endonuclease